MSAEERHPSDLKAEARKAAEEIAQVASKRTWVSADETKAIILKHMSQRSVDGPANSLFRKVIDWFDAAIERCGESGQMCMSRDQLTTLREALTFPSPVASPALPDGWIKCSASLPEDDSDVFAAIWCINKDNAEYSHYAIHDCSYYEGGPGSGQKIFSDCEGNEFDAEDVAYWIYKKDLESSLPRA